MDCFLETQLTLDDVPNPRMAKGSYAVLVLAKSNPRDGFPLISQQQQESTLSLHMQRMRAAGLEPPAASPAPSLPAQSASLFPALIPPPVVSNNSVLLAQTRPGVCLVVFTSKGRQGSFYPLFGNIERVFAKFSHEGKATLVLKAPRLNIFISRANPAVLAWFLRAVDQAKATPQESIPESELALPGPQKQPPASGSPGVSNQSPPAPSAPSASSTTTAMAASLASGIAPTQRSLTVSNVKVLARKLPQTLEAVAATSLQLTAIPSAVLELPSLVYLNLSDNSLAAIPASLAAVAPTLRTLILDRNLLVELPVAVLSAFAKLAVLSLASNRVARLPARICLALTSLHKLDLSGNQLTVIPAELSRLKFLLQLNVSGNRLSYLPADVLRGRLQTLQVSRNPFVKENWMETTLFPFPTLYELAARAAFHVIDVDGTGAESAPRRGPNPSGSASAFQKFSSRAPSAPPRRASAAARPAKCVSLETAARIIPAHVLGDLSAASRCSECGSIFLRTKCAAVEVVSLSAYKNLVQIEADDPVHTRVPVLHRWCSPRCARGTLFGRTASFSYASVDG